VSYLPLFDSVPNDGKWACYFFSSDHNPGGCAAGDINRSEQCAGTIVAVSTEQIGLTGLANSLYPPLSLACKRAASL
jgi:hypothetical protein